jgi:hypothetical protein
MTDAPDKKPVRLDSKTGPVRDALAALGRLVVAELDCDDFARYDRAAMVCKQAGFLARMHTKRIDDVADGEEADNLDQQFNVANMVAAQNYEEMGEDLGIRRAPVRRMQYPRAGGHQQDGIRAMLGELAPYFQAQMDALNEPVKQLDAAISLRDRLRASLAVADAAGNANEAQTAVDKAALVAVEKRILELTGHTQEQAQALPKPDLPALTPPVLARIGADFDNPQLEAHEEDPQ